MTLRREVCGRQREGVAGKEGRLVRRGRAVERTGRVRSGGGGGSGVEQSGDEGIRFPSIKAAERGGERLGQFSLQTLSDFKGVES